MNRSRDFALLSMLLPLLAYADVVTEWNTLLLDAVRNESTSPPLAARNMAIVHVSISDAVNAIVRAHEPYLMPFAAPSGASPEAAAVGAAYECLSVLYPSQSASFDTALERFLAKTPATQGRDDGLILGQWIAFNMLDWRGSDGSGTTVPYVPSTAPGAWRRTPPFFRPPELPQWPYVEPFALTNGAQFRPPGPPSLNSSQYAAEVNQVKALGGINSTNRTAEQTLIARFWSDFSYTVTPPGHWNQIAQNVMTNRPTTLVESARLFALLNIAMADAGIVVWDSKYIYNFWRPVTAIQRADTDGNPDTEADPDWLPLLNTPPFPEYVSGHSAFSSAAATVLAAFYGSDNVPFTVGSDSVPGVLRSYQSFAAAAEEIALSRIYGGIHFLSADVEGLEAGRHVGDYVFGHFLRRLNAPAKLRIGRALTAGEFRVVIDSDSGQNCVLETSNDLTHWTAVATNETPFTFIEPVSSGTAVRFYRALSVP